ncbi:metallophosphoesterase family protein [Alteribacillus iranensis]|uniref:DNA repair exonuclease SbcCD nuclease subunit n=1 Tax=Alteribacillus iranensis TaxID=930128 RepID=A0A1I1Z7N9_9BACI|nr:DNA repair exonuclease [Alteribacillus iranensis]SFE26340.1 DNA repair exonuclease SbcCD nuclease subunit [Alteribacillus iranensis]
MEHVRFIHAADMHIGSPISVAKGSPYYIKELLQDSIYIAFTNLVRDAIDYDVDFVILAGDLFDQTNRGIRSQLFLRKQFLRLEAKQIPVYIVFGNHDPVDVQYAPMNWPANVHIFSSSPECKRFCKNDTIVHLYGCSYKGKVVHENLAKSYEKKAGAHYHIGVLHGQEGQGLESHSYAPFTKRDLLEKNMDYWALGHIHRRSSLSERIHYPGNIQGRHRKEVGKKGYLLVELEGGHSPSVSFQSTAPILITKVKVRIEDNDTIDSVTDKLLAAIATKKRDAIKGICVEVELVGAGPLYYYIQEEMNEWVAALNEIGESEQTFFYIFSIINGIEPLMRTENNHFVKDILESADYLSNNPDILEKEWDVLLQHPSLRPLLSSHSIDKSEVMAEAKQWIRLLWKGDDS